MARREIFRSLLFLITSLFVVAIVTVLWSSALFSLGMQDRTGFVTVISVPLASSILIACLFYFMRPSHLLVRATACVACLSMPLWVSFAFVMMFGWS